MNKIFIIYITCVFSILRAAEPQTAILEAIYSNDIQKFQFSSYNFYCNAYGITTIEDLDFISKEESLCKKSIHTFYKKNPKSKYYLFYKLHLKELYHLEVIEKECIVYVDGEKTLSELLLEKGLAMKKESVENKELKHSFYKVELRAKKNQAGIWNSKIPVDCISEIKESQKRTQ